MLAHSLHYPLLFLFEQSDETFYMMGGWQDTFIKDIYGGKLILEMHDLKGWTVSAILHMEHMTV